MRHWKIEDTCCNSKEQEIDKRWSELQQILNETTEEVLPKVKTKAKQKWMTEDILNLMENRRHVKGKDLLRYKAIDKLIREECVKAKERWLNEQCKQIEDLEKINTNKIYDKIKELTGMRRNTRSSNIKNKEGEVVTAIDDVLKRWEQYTGELFGSDRGEMPEIHDEYSGPSILKAEIRAALKKMKGRRSPVE